jgi:hypothetical protein
MQLNNDKIKSMELGNLNSPTLSLPASPIIIGKTDYMGVRVRIPEKSGELHGRSIVVHSHMIARGPEIES